MTNMGEQVNRIYGYPVGGDFGYGGSTNTGNSSSMGFMNGFAQGTSIFGNNSGSTSGASFINNFNNNFNRGFNSGFNTNLSGGFTFSNFEGVNTSALNNGVSWNNMNNPALYRFPQINDNDTSAFTMPSRSSISYIDEVLKPLPNLKVSESSDYASYSMYGSGSSISYIDDLVKPVNWNFNNGYTNPYNGGGFGQTNGNNNSINRPTPYIPSYNGIYDQKSYQQYLDSVWGSNYANSIPSPVQQNQNAQGAKNTPNGQNNTGNTQETQNETASEEAQKLNEGRPKTNEEKDLKEKVDRGEATEEEQSLQETLDDRDDKIKNNKELRKDVAKLFEALTLNQEDRAEKILTKYKGLGKLGELEEAFLIADCNNTHTQLREAIADSFTMTGFGWATKRYSPKVQKYLNMLDEQAALSSPVNTALALRQTLTDGPFGFRVNQNRIRKLLNALKEKDSTFINMVNDIYSNQISGTSFYTDLNAKYFTPKDIKELASSIFD